MSNNHHNQQPQLPPKSQLFSHPAVIFRTNSSNPSLRSTHQSTIEHRPLPVPSYLYVSSHSTAIPQSSSNPRTDFSTQSPTPTPSPLLLAEHSMPPEQSVPPEHQRENAASKDPKKQSFWEVLGTSTLVDWLADYDNHKRLNAPRPVSGCKPIDVRKEIAALVNRTHGTEWDESNVKSKIQYAKKKYQDAKAILASTGEGNTDYAILRKRILEICPPFDRLHAVYSGTLSHDAPPPVQTSRYANTHAFDSNTTNTSGDSDIEAEGNPGSSSTSEATTVTAKRKN